MPPICRRSCICVDNWENHVRSVLGEVGELKASTNPEIATPTRLDLALQAPEEKKVGTDDSCMAS